MTHYRLRSETSAAHSFFSLSRKVPFGVLGTPGFAKSQRAPKLFYRVCRDPSRNFLLLKNPPIVKAKYQILYSFARLIYYNWYGKCLDTEKSRRVWDRSIFSQRPYRFVPGALCRSVNGQWSAKIFMDANNGQHMTSHTSTCTHTNPTHRRQKTETTEID